ncbi:aggregation-promoting factor C-terminal-like domain-containing protein [Kineosporia babensis]|uniref:Lytic transglycosylase domain-containing protein n=1 Tax=Kineosporia babensis TaxID=499548 RepID=A0A9X1NAF4_9ACTN|nr:hypothetical protein [Kineosporia babensis]MCD5310508.1 hypothetical protein [Kineosporia babensis]
MTEQDLADHWLDTGGIPVLNGDGTKVYPKRSDLRRAEARATTRRGAGTRPVGARRFDSLPSHERPSAPISALRSPQASRRPALQDRYSIATVPTAAVLPTPRTSPRRPAGIDVPMPPSPDAFHRVPPQAAPIAVSTDWGLDLTEEESAPSDVSPRSGRLRGTATRLLVMALVVGAEGVAFSQFAGPIAAPDSNATTTAAFALEDAQKQAQRDAAAQEAEEALAAEKERAETTAVALEKVKDASPAKAQAALDQAKKAKATQARERKEAQERKEKAEAAREAKAAQAAQAAERKKAAEPKAEEKKAAPTSSRKKALAVENARKNPQAAAKVLLTDRGWSSTQYTCLDSLWTRESNWNYQATNPSSGAYGIPQALPGDKMGASGSDWKTNPITQIRWGLDYIAERYGNPCGAWEHSEAKGWY